MSKNYLDNVSLEPEFIGLPSLLNPFPGKLASARNNMFAGNISQFVQPKKGEHPDIFTGFEMMVGDYCFDTVDLQEDIKVVSIIPKFRKMFDMPSTSESPTLFVFYIGMDTNKLGYFKIDRYTKLSNGYGYKNIQTEDFRRLIPNEIISKGTKLYSSPAHEDGEYKVGVNANVCYITDIGTTEDSFKISESFAKRLSPIGIETYTINISQDNYCLNMYGDEEEFKIIPDIGCRTREDGILCSFRNVTEFSVVNDLHMTNLAKKNMHDTSVKCVPGAEVIDIDVYMNPKLKLPTSVFDQVQKYNKIHTIFYKSVLELYEKYRDHVLTEKANTLISRAATMTTLDGDKSLNIGRVSRIVSKKQDIDIRLVITVKYDIHVNRGFKLTGRDGAKGVVGVIAPDEDMPIDENGIRADLLIDPMSIIKRTNVSQRFEQFINRTSVFVQRHIQDMSDADAYEYVLKYIGKVNSNYADLIRRELSTQEDIREYVNECRTKSIQLNIPPMIKGIDGDMIIDLADTYGSRATPVQFASYKTGVRKMEKTKSPIMIGKKFVYLLFKYPKAMGPAMGYVNQFRIPVRPSSDMYDHMSRTPIRFGEDEFRIITAVMGPDPMLRSRAILGTSKKGKEMLLESLLATDKPYMLDRLDIELEELQQDDFILSIISSSFQAFGIDMFNVKITEEEANAMFELVQDK